VVTLSLARENEYAAISVSDTGAGIAAGDLPHLFDRFYRVDRARSYNHGGAGLGLAIVKWIAEAHGGGVAVTSTLGVGSCFTIFLPLDDQILPGQQRPVAANQRDGYAGDVPVVGAGP
jgi:signal transduction histidine kinase